MGVSGVKDDVIPFTPRVRSKAPFLQTKVFVIYQRVYTQDSDKPNVRVLDVKLSREAAQAIMDGNTGTWCERHMADKRLVLTQRK